jgi:hypothetical protein
MLKVCACRLEREWPSGVGVCLHTREWYIIARLVQISWAEDELYQDGLQWVLLMSPVAIERGICSNRQVWPIAYDYGGVWLVCTGC